MELTFPRMYTRLMAKTVKPWYHISSIYYQLKIGYPDDDVKVPKRRRNTAARVLNYQVTATCSLSATMAVFSSTQFIIV